MSLHHSRAQVARGALRASRIGSLALALIALCATCDASTALAPAQARRVALAWEGDTLMVAGSARPATVSVTVDGEPYPLARLRLASSDPAVLAVEADGITLSARRLGTATVTVQLLDATLPLPLPTLTKTLVVAPSSMKIAGLPDTLRSIGDTVRLQALALDANGQPMSGITPAWASSDTAVLTVDAAGLMTTRGNGDAEVRADLGAGTVVAPAAVRQRAAAMRFTPAAVLLDALGDDSLLTVTLVDARGAALALPADPATWSSAAPAVATVRDGRVTAVGAGTAWVQASAAGIRDSVQVDVVQRATRVVIETPLPVVMQSIGETVVLRARAYDRRNNEITSAVPAWRSLEPLVVYVESRTGIATALSTGVATLAAELDGAGATAEVDVANIPARLVLEPEVATLTSVGDTLQLQWAVRNARGVDIAGVAVQFTSTDSAVVAALPTGRAVAVSAGTARLIATAESGIADTTLLTVTNLPVFVDIAGDVDTIPSLTDSVALVISVRNARDAELGPSALTWSVDDPGVARVSALGVVTARDAGATWVRASGGTVRDSIRIVVTNEPASLVITLPGSSTPAALDTMTAGGQAIAYAAAVRNAAGLPIVGAAVEWRSSDAAVVQLSTTGTATAVGYGSAYVIARAGLVEDSTIVVVADPRRLYVDNAAIATVRFGTVARPYATIQDAVNAASVDDTVIVRRGNGYSEAVTLGRRITLLGDSAAFVAGGRNPMLLPRLLHDLGPAGISASTPGGSYAVRYLAIQHSVDGEAVAVRDAANVLLDAVYVNPVAGFRTGRGILIEGTSGTALVTDSRVDSVFAFGVRVRDAADARLERVTVRGVAARSGYSGAGIEAARVRAFITAATVRGTAGPQVLFTATTDASLLAGSFAGEQQLVRLDSVRGSTTVRGNTFDLRRLDGAAAPARGGSAPDPSGLEILASAGVLVDDNTFVDVDGRTSLMDGIRLDGTRVGATGAPYGARVTGNRFRGSRNAIRATRSTWALTGSRVDSAAVAVMLSDADTVSLVNDTLALSRTAAVQSTGLASSITIADAEITGEERAVVVTNAAAVSMRRTAVSGTPGASVVQATLGAVDLSATSVVVVGNTISRIAGWAGLVLRTGTARADSNIVSRNVVGVRLGTSVVPSMEDNAIFDNDTLPAGAVRATLGVVSDGVVRALGTNWWGAPDGYRSDVPVSPRPAGDSVVRITAGIRTLPLSMHQGSATAASVRKIAGDGQEGLRHTPLAQPLLVRAVDAAGRPAADSVTFRVDRALGTFAGAVRSGNEQRVTVAAGADGLAAAEFIPLSPGAIVITAAAGPATVTFTATAR